MLPLRIVLLGSLILGAVAESGESCNGRVLLQEATHAKQKKLIHVSHSDVERHPHITELPELTTQNKSHTQSANASHEQALHLKKNATLLEEKGGHEKYTQPKQVDKKTNAIGVLVVYILIFACSSPWVYIRNGALKQVGHVPEFGPFSCVCCLFCTPVVLCFPIDPQDLVGPAFRTMDGDGEKSEAAPAANKTVIKGYQRGVPGRAQNSGCC
eukprot:TRINITY_DN7309_c0_g4_i1.p1 TRINITY_DN7309_c0_g4~~TRINITY_DN7309_c0_g4_i1.p1  ORF type:complete len:213 (+),score=23.86 TRINITY_DN7309_c0_g4_i1:95-733(+)